MTSSSDKKGDNPTRVGGVPVYKISSKSRPAVLRLIKGPQAPQIFPLELPEIVIGRGNDAHIVIESDAVSRRHVAFKQSSAGHVCEDLGSSNGVYVNGEKVSAVELQDGDTVQVGDSLFVYQACTL